MLTRSAEPLVHKKRKARRRAPETAISRFCHCALTRPQRWQPRRLQTLRRRSNQGRVRWPNRHGPGQRLDPRQDALGSAPMLVNVAVLVAVVAAIAMAAERRPRSGRRRAHPRLRPGRPPQLGPRRPPWSPQSMLAWRRLPKQGSRARPTRSFSQCPASSCSRWRELGGGCACLQTAHDSNGLARTA
jgi:hypothetical protein